MHTRHILIVLSVVATMAAVAVVVSAGNPSTPPGPPETTSSYTLEDIYSRLATGAASTETTFTEPINGPTVGTMHTLNDTMGAAPTVDDTKGAGVADVASGKTFWGLTSGVWGLQTGTATSGGGAAVPKTGQVISYTIGDDGDLERGVAWPVPRFTDNDDGTVMDNLTGLIWLRDANCNGQETWPNALTWANGLCDGCESCGGSNNDCGLSDGSSPGDWRLPNVRELLSLVHFGFCNPAVPNTAGTGKWSEWNPFTDVWSDAYWSSNTDVYNPSFAWAMHLDRGSMSLGGKTNYEFMWPVRGGQ